MFESPRYVRGLTGVGASAYVLKSTSSEHLVAAVRAAVLDPASENVVVGMPEGMLEGTEEGAESVLSGRELEIVLFAARGLSNGQIAASLHLSEATVERGLANVYEKMGVSSRGEAAREALLRDWITIEEVTEDAGKEEGPGYSPGLYASGSASEEAASTAASRSSVEASLSSVRTPSALRRASMPPE